MTYAASDLMAEVAYVSQAYGWSLGAALDLEHGDRHDFIELATASRGIEEVR